MNWWEQKRLGIPENEMLLYCGPCRSNFRNLTEWGNHLVGKFHQNRSRHCISNAVGHWGRPTERPSILVAHSTVPFSSAKCKVTKTETCFAIQFLRLMSRACHLVPSDFIWIPSHPKVAIVRFPSQMVADDVMKILNGRMITGMAVVTLKKATEFNDLEWNQLIDEGIVSSLISVGQILSLK